MSEPCMSVPQLAKHFGVGRTTIHNAVVSGEIPSIRLGTIYRVRLSEVPEHLVDRWTTERTPLRTDLPSGPMVYFLGVPGFVKIGFTTDLPRRVSELQPGSPVRLELLAHLPGGTFADEKQYHREFRKHRAEGEWFHHGLEISQEIERLRS